MRGSRLLACLVFVLCLSSLAGCTGSTVSPTANPTIAVPSTAPVPTVAPTLAATVTPERKDRIPLWDSGYWYLLGVNYPWLNYGHDFGTTAWGHDGVSSPKSRDTVEADLAYLQSQGVHVVRWFVFGDGRASPSLMQTAKSPVLTNTFTPT